MAYLSIRLLGPIRVELDGKPVTGFATDKTRALLAYLVVEADRPHSRKTLAGLLWPDYPERSARNSLRTALVNLRSVTGDREADPHFLHISRQAVQFNADSDAWCDVKAFHRLVTPPSSSLHREKSAKQLEEAVELYRASFLEGFSLADSVAFEDWALIKREQLQRRVLEALQRLAIYNEERGDCEKALQFVWRQVELDPWQEDAQRQLMRLLALSGQRGASLTQYESLRRLLADELGVEPAKETKTLYERIRTGAEDIIEQSIATRPDTKPVPNNLPAETTAFIGREAELAEIERLLQDPDCRLLTLVGFAGSGKTRLALKAAAGRLADFKNGVFFASLTPLQSVETIAPTVAEALGFHFYSADRDRAGETPEQQLLNYLRPKNLLLILDNFEHLLTPHLLKPSKTGRVPPVSTQPNGTERGREGGTELVSEILGAAPLVKVLATSRVRLNVGGEHRFRVDGMDYPEKGTTRLHSETLAHQREDAMRYSAVKLFVQAARRAQPGFELTHKNVRAVVDVCRLVQGNPLGIRLAAAWVDILPLAQIATQLSTQTRECLDLLVTERRDVPKRQRSMRAALNHSWILLTYRERKVMQALSVFRGSFTRQAAQYVAGASLQELRALVDKSQLQPIPGPLTVPRAEGRYELHELLRQHAVEKLAEDLLEKEQTQDRHCDYYVAFLENRREELQGSRQKTAAAEIEQEIDNARTAWNWAVEQNQIQRLDRTLDVLCGFYSRLGRCREGEAVCRLAAERLLAVHASRQEAAETLPQATSGEGLQVLSRILTWQAAFTRDLGNIDAARQLTEQSLALLDKPRLAHRDTRREKAFALLHIGRCVSGRQGVPLWEQSLALYRALDDRWMTANVLHMLGTSRRTTGAYAEGQRLCEASLEIRRALDDRKGIADSLVLLSDIAWARGEFEEQESLAREALVIFEQLGDRYSIALGTYWLSWALLALGKYPEARSSFEECQTIFTDLGLSYRTTYSTINLGFAEMHLGQYEAALVRGQEGVTLERTQETWGGYALFLLGCITVAQRAYAEAQGMLQQSAAIFGEREMGWIPVIQAYAARGLGHLPQARRHLCDALRKATKIGAFLPFLWALPAAALLLTDQGESERAVELYALATRYPLVANSQWFEDVAGMHIAAAASTLSAQKVAKTEERGRARDIEATVAELLAELETKQAQSN
jgi:DNA-binding SARP family transcriptional activator/predicted ATPase